MSSIKDIIKESLSNFANSLKETYTKKNDIIDNLNSTDSTKPLSANMGNNIKNQIDTHSNDIDALKTNMIHFNRWYVGPGESIRISCMDANAYGNLILFSTFMVIPEYKSIFFTITGNGNNTNSGQYVIITKVLESSIVTVTRVDEYGAYNDIIISNNGIYAIWVNASTLHGTPPTKVS